MGQELAARVRYLNAAGEQSSEGRALLEASELVFRGSFRLRIPFREIFSVDTADGLLEVNWPEGGAVFDLGVRYAAAWADKIRNPKGLLDKLGVKPGMKVCVLNIRDEAFLGQLRTRTDDIRMAAMAEPCDLIFYGADEASDLARLAGLRASIKDEGAVWVVSPKGKAARLRDVEVIEAAKSARLVDTKVVSFSETHTALKLVVPVALRGSTVRRQRAAGD